MLRFNKGDNAVFIGKEAEGPHRGQATVFIVGSPPVQQILLAIQELHSRYRYINYGLYLGAGGCIEDILDFDKWKKLLLAQKTAFGSSLGRIAIECKDPYIVSSHFNSLYAMLREYPIVMYVEFEVIVPLRFDNYIMENNVVEQFIALDKSSHYNGFKVYGKIYIPNKLTIVAPLRTMYIAANYDINEGEYRKDLLVWKEEKNAIA